MKEINNAISAHFIKCELSKAVNTETIWKSSSVDLNSATEFSSQYSYLVNDTNIFSNVILDNNNVATAEIERYGGGGLGGNGGGSRSANIDDAQVKGIGANILVGEGVPLHHSYGGLDIYCAVIEIIQTELLNRILPLGAVSNKGLILIDKHAGSYDGAECWAVLLVREKPLRPGHLLHASDFIPKASFNWKYRSEESRIRNIYRDLDETIGTTNFVLYLGKFLAATANQFAFARMSRLLHGGLSESNMSMDGKWLDTPLVGFVPAGRNWSQQSDIYSEPFEALKFIGQCTYNYTKYSRKILNPQPLYHYYIEQLNDYKKLHCTFLLGIDSAQMELIYNHEEVSALCMSLENLIISTNQETIKRYIPLNENDPLDVEIINIWHGIVSIIRCAGHPSSNADLTYKILTKIESSSSENAKCLAMQSIKRLLLCRFFYLKNSIEQVLNSFSNKEDITNPQSHTTNYIEKRIELINWIYEKNSLQAITLINIPRLSVKYNREKNHYILLIDERKFTLETMLDVNQLIQNAEIQLIYLDFHFDYYLKTISDLLCKLEIQ